MKILKINFANVSGCLIITNPNTRPRARVNQRLTELSYCTIMPDVDRTVESYLDEITAWRSGARATIDLPANSKEYTEFARREVMRLEREIVKHNEKHGSGEHPAVQPAKAG